MPRLTVMALAVAAVVMFVVALGLPARAPAATPNAPAASLALTKKLHRPVPPKLVAMLDTASKKGLALGAPAAAAYFRLKAISGPHLKVGSKVGLLYIGAEFCPYCAGQRWGLVLTLLRFGKFTGLRYMLSSATDVYPNTPTVTFEHATYQSKYVAFQAVEVEDRNGQPLVDLSKFQEHIFDTYDAPPYFRYSGGIPFVYVNGDYLPSGLMVRPKQLTGMNWQQITDALANPHSGFFESVMPRVNLMTAAICHLDGGKPADVCTSPGVVATRGKLPKHRPAKG